MTEDRAREDVHEFVERFARWLEHSGVPRMAGRVLGWLLVCEPAHQSADELTAALQASRGSISTTARMLTGTGLVERVTFPGDRRTYYRAVPNWNSLLESQFKQVTELRQLLEDGLETVATGSSAERLRQVLDFACFWEAELAKLIAERADR